jgi:hypothetical protein
MFGFLLVTVGNRVICPDWVAQSADWLAAWLLHKMQPYSRGERGPVDHRQIPAELSEQQHHPTPRLRAPRCLS